MNNLELKRFRTEMNLSQEDLAKIVGKTIRAVQSWEQGVRRIPESALLLMQNFAQNDRINKNLTNEEFLSHIPEPLPTINPSVEDLVNKAKALKKSKSEPTSKVINEEDLVEAVEYIVPFKGQAGLASKQYPDEMVGELKKRVIKVKPEHRGVFYTIEADGNSMPPKILPGDWLRCEEISSLFWFEQNFFKKDKIYCIWDNERGILFKRIIYKDDGIWCVSDNQDKKTYPDFSLNLAQVNKILVVRKLVDRNF